MNSINRKDEDQITKPRQGIVRARKGTVGNYKKGPWDQVDHEAGETEAAHIGMNQQLTEYPEVDHQMDRYQETGYSYLEWIVKHSVDPWARRAARQALAAFHRAEEMEAICEEHVEASREELVKARAHNHNVIGVAEQNRGVHVNGADSKVAAS